MLINFSEKVKKIKELEKQQPKLITFLGFAGATNCMLEIHREAKQLNIQCAEASPKDPSKLSWFSSPLIKLDAVLMKKYKVHLGLSRSHNQSKAAYQMLMQEISPETPIILCGHSQGGLIALNFWDQHKKQLNIKGIILLSSPLNGVTFFKSIDSAKKLKEAAIISEYNSFFKLKLEPLLFAYVYFPMFKLASKAFFPALTDFLMKKKFTDKVKAICENLKTSELPVLNITCSCPAPIITTKLPYSVSAMKMLSSGGLNLDSDNILALHDQKFPSKWKNLTEIFIKADHGAFNVPDAPKIFQHQETLSSIKNFLKDNFLR